MLPVRAQRSVASTARIAPMPAGHGGDAISLVTASPKASNSSTTTPRLGPMPLVLAGSRLNAIQRARRCNEVLPRRDSDVVPGL